MKYINFKRYKFSTVVKNINTIIYNFLKIFKFIDLKRYNFRKIYKYPDFGRNYFRKAYKYFDFRSYNFRKIYKYLDFRRYDFYRIDKKINFKNYKHLPIYFIVSAIVMGFIYLAIPMFYSYDKSNIETIICKDENIRCVIKGRVNYSFYPSPRIKIKDLIIKDYFKKEENLATVKNVVIKLSLDNLLNKKKQNYKKIELKNFVINFDLKSIKKYKNIFIKKTNSIPIVFTKGQIKSTDGKNYVATIHDAVLNLIFKQDTNVAILKGKFLNDDIYISLNSKKVDSKEFTDIILKMSDLNLLAKANFFNPKGNEDITSGNILIKKGKNRLTAIFDYENNEFTINKSNLRNTFIDGKLEGKITLLPYFNFNLDINLNSINFTKLYNYFLNLDENDKKKLFKINNKINGKLNFSSDKVYSRYNLVKSFESRIKFYNGNVSIDQFLINLGKLGAADILGGINNDKKFANFKFESNIFVDNSKKFLSKFGIYNKQTIPSNLFVSGIFDLENIRISFYEISNGKKLNREDVDYIEREFNDLMLEDGYTNLFYFPIFKEFLKSIIIEKN